MAVTHSRDTLVFRYAGFDLSRADSVLTCTYEVGGYTFRERVHVEGADWSAADTEPAARLVFLLAGVSYYKAFAAPVVDLGDLALSPTFVRDLFVDGLGEYAFRNGIDLTDVRFDGELPAITPGDAANRESAAPLVPFGGGIDSIVVAEAVKSVVPDTELFVVSRESDRFDAIERAAKTTGLAVRRASRSLDSKILESSERGWLNGHVPVTGILSAIAVLAAVTSGRDAVVMSNEWSASAGNVKYRGRVVNHQYSKSLQFEEAFRDELAKNLTSPPQYFSLLRPFSELWVAERFGALTRYHGTFRSCNRAFQLDPMQRAAEWCCRCDKCVFIDLILSPFISRNELSQIFHGDEPLENPALMPKLRTLVGLSSDTKPFECVGDVSECRAAATRAARRLDRRDNQMLAQLAAELSSCSSPVHSVESLSRPLGPHFIPEPYATALGLE